MSDIQLWKFSLAMEAHYCCCCGQLDGLEWFSEVLLRFRKIWSRKNWEWVKWHSSDFLRTISNNWIEWVFLARLYNDRLDNSACDDDDDAEWERISIASASEIVVCRAHGCKSKSWEMKGKKEKKKRWKWNQRDFEWRESEQTLYLCAHGA